MQPKKPSPLAISLPSTPTPLSDKFELTSLDNEPTTQYKPSMDKKKSTLDYVKKAALQLYQQDAIPWQKYMRHLKKKQKVKKNAAPATEPQDWNRDSDVVTHF